MFRRAVLYLGCAGSVYCCRANEQAATARSRERPGIASARPSNAAQANAAPSSVAPAVSTPALLRALALPGLHPIAKAPFPEGVEQATLCAAIESKEPDLWLRFGHFIPLYERGVLYVLNTGEKLTDKLRDYMAREYKPGWNALLGSCAERTLVYIRVMYGDAEYDGKPFGRMHLAQQLEKRFGLEVLENIQLEGDSERLGKYCRADAELCDALVKLHPGNRGLGLCSHAIVPCLNAGRGTREELQAICKGTPRSVLACSEYHGSRAESFACDEALEAALCPPPITSP